MYRKLHWSAVVAAGCSYWLLAWLFLIASTLFEISLAEGDNSGLRSTVYLFGVFALWSAYRGIRRLVLLGNGGIITAEVFKESHESYDINSGSTGKVSYKSYRYKVNGEVYTNTMILSTTLIGIQELEIVYHTGKPSYSLPISRLRVRFNRSAKQWQSSMGLAVPRLTLLVVFAGGILAALARGISFS
jgi:sensor histidine kinase YesM